VDVEQTVDALQQSKLQNKCSANQLQDDEPKPLEVAIPVLPPISSPTRRSLGGAPSHKCLPNFEGEYFDENGVHMISFTPTNQEIKVEVSNEDMAKVLVVAVSTDGSRLESVDWAEGADKADFIIRTFRNEVPHQLILRCTGSKINTVGNKDTRGKKPVQDRLVCLFGTCMAAKHGCETKYNTSFDTE